MKSSANLCSEKGGGYSSGMWRLFPRHRHLLLLFLFLILLALLWIASQGKFNPKILRHPPPPSPPSSNMVEVDGNGQISTTIHGSKKLPMDSQGLDCGRIYSGDQEYAKRRTGKQRLAMAEEPAWLDMDCGAVKARNGFVERKIIQEEAEMPLAFARIIHRDYYFLEMELLTHWTAQNWYCFVLDEKAEHQFRVRMHSLASCFPNNVFIAQREFNINGTGTNTSDAFMECARELARPERKWNYLVTLQNHDLQAKTNAEMVRIFRHMGGANDVEMARLNEFTQQRLGYYRENFNWTFEQLRLFKNDSQNRQKDARGQPMALHLAKGYSTASLSRKFINFIVNQLDLTILLDQLNQGYFGMDEHLWQSLSTTDALDAPGGFPQRCFDDCKDNKGCFKTMNGKMNYVTRFALWLGDTMPCRSGNVRHSVCVFGLEDLGHGTLESVPHLFINKMMPEFDFGAVLCWNERMRNRTMRGEMGVDEAFYEDWPQTRYQRLREGFQGREADLRKAFDCQTGKMRGERENETIKRSRRRKTKDGRKRKEDGTA